MRDKTDIRTRLNNIVPQRIGTRLKLARLKLLVAVLIWLAIGIYSGMATFLGYKIANLGNVSLVITIASQFFTMAYAIPEFESVSRRFLKNFTIPTLIALCLGAHVISFLGSAFFHYTKASTARELGLTANQVEVLDDTGKKIKFNTLEFASFLEGLTNMYEGKAEASDNGKGITGRTGKGDRYRLYMNAASEVRLNREMLDQAIDFKEIDTLVHDTPDPAEFIRKLRTLPTSVLHQESEITTLGEAGRQLAILTGQRPSLDYETDEKVPDPKYAREILSTYVHRYPFVRVENPVEEVLTGGGKAAGMRRIFDTLNPFGDSTTHGYNESVGLLVGAILEISVFIFNIFVNLIYRNVQSILRRKDRSTIINAAYSCMLSITMRLTSVSENVQRLNTKTVVFMLDLAKRHFDKGLDRRRAMKCTELSCRPYDEEEQERSMFRSVWNTWGRGSRPCITSSTPTG